MHAFPVPVYGETGTAQYLNSKDYAWYTGFVPATATSKPIVVTVWVEKGGFGDVAAAPVARQILSQWFLGKPGPYVRTIGTPGVARPPRRTAHDQKRCRRPPFGDGAGRHDAFG